MPLYLAFVDLTKSFDTVSREGMYLTLSKTDWSLNSKAPQPRHILPSEYEGNITVQFDGNLSEMFVNLKLDICNGVKQGYILAPTLFEIFFSMLLKHAFVDTNEGIFLRTRSFTTLPY